MKQYKEQQYRSVANTLREIKRKVWWSNRLPWGKQRRLGICAFVATLASHQAYNCWFDSRNQAFTSWPFFSGDVRYPVPANRAVASGYASTETRHVFSVSINKFDPKTEYGQARLALLDYLIFWYDNKADQLLADSVKNTPRGCR